MSIILEFQRPPGKAILRGEAFFWECIRELGQKGSTFTGRDVLLRTNRTEKATLNSYLNRLELAGIIEDTGETVDISTNVPSRLFRLVKAPITTPRLTPEGRPTRQGRGQVQMWNVLRGPESRAGISSDDLALRAATDEVGVTKETAKAYLKHLNNAGYLIQVRRGIWKLRPDRNTGPKPPLILRSKIVYDQNQREAMAPIEAEEAGS